MSSESIALSGTATARCSILEKAYGYLAKLLSVAMLIGLQSTSLPGQSHVAEPALNLGDTSFLDAPALPGFVLEQIADGTRWPYRRCYRQHHSRRRRRQQPQRPHPLRLDSA